MSWGAFFRNLLSAFEIRNSSQTFVADIGHNYSAPYWMGEFGCGGGRWGNKTDKDQKVCQKKMADLTKFWHLHEKIHFSENWEKIVRFLNETDHDFAYWSIDGYIRWVQTFEEKINQLIYLMIALYILSQLDVLSTGTSAFIIIYFQRRQKYSTVIY